MPLSNLRAFYLQIIYTFLRFIYIFIFAFIIKLIYFVINIANLYLILRYKLTAFKVFSTFLTLAI
jgi:hypothetical protein